MSNLLDPLLPPVQLQTLPSIDHRCKLRRPNDARLGDVAMHIQLNGSRGDSFQHVDRIVSVENDRFGLALPLTVRRFHLYGPDKDIGRRQAGLVDFHGELGAEIGDCRGGSGDGEGMRNDEW